MTYHVSHTLRRFAIVAACATLLLIVVGGLVTSNDAGDSVPDWPLSFGHLIPWQQLVGNVLYEYGHRVVAASVGVLTIILNILLWRRERRRWVRRVGLAALAAVILQGGLGGIRVLLLDVRFAAAMVHACLAQIFFCLMVSLVVFTSPTWLELSDDHSRPTNATSSNAFYLCAATVAAVFLQLVLGAAFRHQAIGILPHIAGAVVVTLLVGWTVWAVGGLASQLSDQPSQLKVRAYLVRPAIAAGGLLVVQLVLGVSAYMARLASHDDPQPLEPMVTLTVTHVAVGAMILAAVVVLALRVHLVVRSPSSVLRGLVVIARDRQSTASNACLRLPLRVRPQTGAAGKGHRTTRRMRRALRSGG